MKPSSYFYAVGILAGTIGVCRAQQQFPLPLRLTPSPPARSVQTVERPTLLYCHLSQYRLDQDGNPKGRCERVQSRLPQSSCDSTTMIQIVNRWPPDVVPTPPDTYKFVGWFSCRDSHTFHRAEDTVVDEDQSE